MDFTKTRDICLNMASTTTAITSQPLTKVDIRPMTRDDSEFVAQMNIQAFHNFFVKAVGENKLEALEENLKLEMSTRPHGGYEDHFVAWLEGERVGYLWLKYHHSKHQEGDISFQGIRFCCGVIRLKIFYGMEESNVPKNMCYLDTIAVDSNFRGNGIGTQLLAKVDQEALKHECSRISLHVADGNPAVLLYERSGYKHVDLFHSHMLKFAIGVGRFHEMEKDLKMDCL